MEENEVKKLPKFDSIHQLADFFDENDMGEYLGSMPEAEFEVGLDRRLRYFAVDEDIAERLSEISRSQHTSSGTILNSWLREKISDHSPSR